MMQYFPKVSATYRRETGSYVNSRWVPDDVGENAIRIVRPQPATGRELQMLPEADRQYRHLKTWCRTELLPNDVITYAGSEYRVVPSMDYQLDGNYHKVIMREVQHER